ncbi:hypothetical protein BGZ63DRAFT_253594 [Mariannaea sp. PMI_226]|nr:hypothetical protein BGZ63DRAFT_253594 [Mariannaea sp. PMI_226]
MVRLNQFFAKYFIKSKPRLVLVLFAWITDLCYFIILRTCMLPEIHIPQSQKLTSPLGMAAGGKYLWNVTPAQLSLFRRLSVPGFVLYCTTNGLTRLALLAFYRRISTGRLFRWCLWSIASLVILYTSVCILLTIFWNDPDTVRRRIDTLNISLAFNAFNIFTDILLISIPSPIIFSLHMPIRQRISIYLILLVGSGAMIISILRLVRVVKIKLESTDKETAWIQSTSVLMGFLEVNLGILCNCLLLMRAFVRRHLPWLLGYGSVESVA